MDWRFVLMESAKVPRTRRVKARFTSKFSTTRAMLEQEVKFLGGTGLIVEGGFSSEQIRNDGWPRSNQPPSHPAVAVSFQSKHGPLRYACDTYTDHEANLRAIALGLEALRSVERYGITKAGEQYRGFKALPEGSSSLSDGDADFPTLDAAARFLCHAAGVAESSPNALRGAELDRVFRMAARRNHPDTGGSEAAMARLNRAKSMLAAATGAPARTDGGA